MAHATMMAGGVMLGEVVSKIVGPGLPVDKKLALSDAVADPVEAHVNCFGSSLFDSVIDDAFSSGIVSFDGSGWLRPAHLFQGGSKGSALLGILEQGTNFGFSGGGQDLD